MAGAPLREEVGTRLELHRARIMVLSWLKRSRRAASVDDLVARRQYAKAVEALRAELGGGSPSAADRLRLADLLVLAERGGEAMPILLALADEQIRYGFLDKASEALRRANEIEPGRPDVGHRIAALRKNRVAPSPSSPASREAETPDWGVAPDGAVPGAPPDDAGSGPNGHGATVATASPDVSEAAGPRGGENGTVRAVVRPAVVLSRAGEPGPAGGPLPGAPPDHEPPELQLVADEEDEDAPELHLVEDEEEEIDASGPPVAASGSPEHRPLLTEEELDADDSEPYPSREAVVGTDLDPALEELHEYLLALGRTKGPRGRGLGASLFARFPRKHLHDVAHGLAVRVFGPGELIVGEGDTGQSVFLIASGSVRVLIMGGHGRPFDIRRLDAGDFFGEVAALSGHPRTATVLASAACELLEVQRDALEALLRLRPGARALIQEVSASRARCQEEEAVRTLPAEVADPQQATAALQAHFSRSEWSPRVRTHLARLMLDAGQQDEALAILAGVNEDLARRGHAQKAITLLKKVESIQRRGVQEVELAPLRPGRRRSARHSGPVESAASPDAGQAVTGAAFREWVGLLIRATDDLAARSAPSGTVGDERAV